MVCNCIIVIDDQFSSYIILASTWRSDRIKTVVPNKTRLNGLGQYTTTINRTILTLILISWLMIASIAHFNVANNQWSYNGGGIGETRGLKPGGGNISLATYFAEKRRPHGAKILFKIKTNISTNITHLCNVLLYRGCISNNYLFAVDHNIMQNIRFSCG